MATKPILSAVKQYDEAKLQAMTEPLFVRVEKIRNGQRMAIPLPESEDAPGQPGGAGYDKDAVRGLEQFLVNEWSGGGSYVIKITDAQNQALEWSTTYPIVDFPERVPPPLQNAAVQHPFASPAPQRRTTNVAAFPQGFPQLQQPFAAQPQYGYQQVGYPQQYMYPPMPAPPPVGTPQYQLWSHEVDKRQESAELRQLREENARRDREALEAKHRAEVERERIANDQRFAKVDQSMVDLRTLIQQLATTITAAAQTNANSAKPNSEIEALKLQLETSKQAAERDRAEREAERRDRDHKEMIKAMQESSQRQFEAMQRQLEAFRDSLSAVNSNKQDPMIEMLREQARQSADAMKEISRNNTQVIEKMQATTLSPRDIIALTRDSSLAAEQITDKLAGTYGRVIDLQTKVTENALQMQPQGSPVVDMIREGFGNVKEMGERYFGRAELQARLEAEKHNQLVMAQRDLEIARMQTQGGQQPGFSGAPHQHQHQQPAMPPAPTRRKKAVGAKAEGAVEVPAPSTKKNLGRTDAEWFGPLLPEILKLRAGVDQFLESIKNGAVTDENVDDMKIGISPNRAAQGIYMGAQMVQEHQVNIPVMDDLLFQHRYGDLMDVILPNAPEAYRVDVLNVLIPAIRGTVGGGEGMTGEEPQQAADENEADETDDDDDNDDQADAHADGDHDDGTDAAQDGAKSPPRGGLAVVPTPPPAAKPGVNGKPMNPPRRA